MDLLCRWSVECRAFDAASKKNGCCSDTIFQQPNYVLTVHWYIECVPWFFSVGCVATLPSASHFVSFFRFHWNFAIVNRILWTLCVRHARTSTSAVHSTVYTSKHLWNFPFWTFARCEVFSARNVRLVVITFLSSDSFIPITASTAMLAFVRKPNLIWPRYWERVLLARRNNE